MKCLLALLLIVVGATAAPAASPFHVLFAPAGGDDVTLRAEIAAELGADSIVDYFDARTGTPSMALLGEYDAVYTAAPFAYADPVLFGDRLAAIVDTGKHVMLGIYTHTQLSGLIVEDEYCPVPTYISAPDAGAGAWDGDQRHSVWDYVEGDLLSPVHQDLEPWAGTEIGAYEDGSTLLAIDFSQRVSYLNGRPVPVGVGQGNWPRLIANTLRFGEALRVAIYEPSLANSNFENRARFVNDVFTIFDDPTAMQQALESGDFDLAVVVEENVVLSVELADALASFVAAGGKAILSYWDLDGSNGPGAAAILRDTFGIAATSSFDQPQSISRWRDESRLYLDVQPYTPDGTSFLVDNGDRLSPAPGAVPLAGFTALPSANDAAIVIANGGRTIVNGFLFDDYAPVVRAVLSQREYDYLATLGRVLHMTTSTRSYLGRAARRLGLEVTDVYWGPTLADDVEMAHYDLVLIDYAFPGLEVASDALAAYVANGGRVIASWPHIEGSLGLSELFGLYGATTVAASEAVHPWAPTHSVFSLPHAIDFPSLATEGVAEPTNAHLLVRPEAQAIAGFTASPTPGEAAMVLANESRTLFIGAPLDDYAASDMLDLSANLITFAMGGSGSATFVRGDANRDGTVEIADAVFGLGALFTGNLPPSCPAACDVNSDATFDISDVVALLSYLFVPGSPAPSAPFPGCGAPTTSDLPCGGETDCP